MNPNISVKFFINPNVLNSNKRVSANAIDDNTKLVIATGYGFDINSAFEDLQKAIVN